MRAGGTLSYATNQLCSKVFHCMKQSNHFRLKCSMQNAFNWHNKERYWQEYNRGLDSKAVRVAALWSRGPWFKSRSIKLLLFQPQLNYLQFTQFPLWFITYLSVHGIVCGLRLAPLNRKTANRGLDSHIEVEARLTGWPRFESHSSKFVSVHPQIIIFQICTHSVSLIIWTFKR